MFPLARLISLLGMILIFELNLLQPMTFVNGFPEQEYNYSVDPIYKIDPSPHIHAGNDEYEIDEYSPKIDTLFELIKRGFDRINDRVTGIEKRIDKLDSTVISMKSKLQNDLESFSQTTKIQMTKVFNVFNETYSVCKQLLALSSQKSSSSSSPFSASSGRSYKANGKKIHDKDPRGLQDAELVEVENGQNDNFITDDEEAKIAALEAISRATVEKYSSTMHRKLEEEFSIINFKIQDSLRDIQNKLDNNSKMSIIREHQSQMEDVVSSIQETTKDNQAVLESMVDSLSNLKSLVKSRDHMIDQHFAKASTSLSNLFHEHHQNMTKLQFNCSTTTNSAFNKTLLASPSSEDGILKFTFFPSSGKQFSSRTSSPETVPESGVTTVPSRSRTSIIHDMNHQIAVVKKFLDEAVKNVTYKPKFMAKKYSKHDQKCNGKVNGFPGSCAEIFRQKNGTCDRVYVITNGNRNDQVYCSDMMHSGNFIRGWTVILRRGRMNHPLKCLRNPAYCDLHFDRKTREYAHGFGDMHSGEFFLGLNTIHRYTNSEPHFLQIDLEDYRGDWASFRYRGFRLGNVESKYEFVFDQIELLQQAESNLPINAYRTAAGSLLSLNGSTFISGSDVSSGKELVAPLENCMKKFKCDWWVRRDKVSANSMGQGIISTACDQLVDVNLFAPLPGLFAEHVFWNNWASLESERRIKNIIMKIRPIRNSGHVVSLQESALLK